jgi:hypothetical protein
LRRRAARRIIVQPRNFVEQTGRLVTMQPVTVITGASSGIGAELARAFSENGHALVLTARREAQLNALADEIAATGRARPHLVVADLQSVDGPERLAQAIAAQGLEPANIVNNAGFGLSGNATDLDIGEQLRMVDLDARALTDLSLRFIDSLARHRGGILNVASIAGFLPGPGMAVYHACKAYVISLSEALHQELGVRGVRVSVLCPGPVPTEFQARAGMTAGFPRYLVRSTYRVARDGYNGFMRGQRIIVPGFHNKVVHVVAHLLPAPVLFRLAKWGGHEPPRP